LRLRRNKLLPIKRRRKMTRELKRKGLKTRTHLEMDFFVQHNVTNNINI